MRNWASSVADLDIERSLVLGNGIKRNNIDFLDKVKNDQLGLEARLLSLWPHQTTDPVAALNAPQRKRGWHFASPLLLPL